MLSIMSIGLLFIFILTCTGTNFANANFFGGIDNTFYKVVGIDDNNHFIGECEFPCSSTNCSVVALIVTKCKNYEWVGFIPNDINSDKKLF